MSQKDKYVQRYKIKILVCLETAQSLLKLKHRCTWGKWGMREHEARKVDSD